MIFVSSQAIKHFGTTNNMKLEEKIFVAGHKGLVGSAIYKSLCLKGYQNIVVRSHAELDLMDQNAVKHFFAVEKPDHVFLAAAKVGGINANNIYPADFIYDNLQIELNVVHFAHKYNVKQLLFLGSSCIYPRLSDQPIFEEYLLGGHLEPTNEPYAISKIAGIKLCESYNRQHKTDFRSVMPTNLYGPEDNFNLETSHVLPALIRKFEEANVSSKESVVIWGTGAARREFLYVDDLADACVHVMKIPKEQYWQNIDSRCSHINVGTGKDLSILELAEIIRDTVGSDAKIEFDKSIPDGAPRKVLNLDRLKQLGWSAQTPLNDGIKKTYMWYLDNKANLNK